MEVGQINKLTVVRETGSGFYLVQDPESEEVFMPPSLALENMAIGDIVEAFIYTDKRNGIIATSKIPTAVVGEFALLTVKDVEHFGAFFEWGIDKDLLVPGNEQKVKIRRGEQHIVRVCLEEETDRVYGTTKLGKYIQETEYDQFCNEKVDLLVATKTEIGFKVIIDKKFIGIIYDNEIFQEVVIGETYVGVVKTVRDDGLLDAALQVQGIKNTFLAKDKVKEMLIQSGGQSPLNDKSAPEDIKSALNMSKKTFKNAIGMLYKDKVISINKDGIELRTP
jgi:uncharacterized protein